jgi:hypothetical protein
LRSARHSQDEEAISIFAFLRFAEAFAFLQMPDADTPLSPAFFRQRRISDAFARRLPSFFRVDLLSFFFSCRRLHFSILFLSLMPSDFHADIASTFHYFPFAFIDYAITPLRQISHYDNDLSIIFHFIDIYASAAASEAR